MSQNILFQNITISTLLHNGQTYLKGSDIARALGYVNVDKASKIYIQYQNEFDSGMAIRIDQKTATSELNVDNKITGLNKKPYYFNRRGAWLIAMFARTPAAAKFRKWVLDVLENHVDEKKAVSDPEERDMIEKTVITQEDVMNDLKAAYNHLFPVMDNLRAYKDLWETRNILFRSSPRQAIALNDVLSDLYAAIQDDVQSSYCAMQDLIDGKKLKAKPNGNISAHYFLNRVSKREK